MEKKPEQHDSEQKTAQPQEKQSIFRSKSIDRISSPEQLNDYVRVASPRMWVVLLAVVVLLAGAVVWSAFGNIESIVYGVAIVDNQGCTVYLRQTDADLIFVGDPVEINHKHVTLETLDYEPFVLDESFPAYARTLGEFSIGEWICRGTTENPGIINGIYLASIAEESITPLSFLTNRN